MKDQHGKVSPPAAHAPRALPLACRECQRKKTKCDRTYPCTPCTRAGIPCVPSTRKPRAKAGVKAVDAELRSRIAKLERLVESFQGEEGKEDAADDADDQMAPSENSPAPGQQHTGSSGSPAPTSPNTTKYIAGSFWSSLTAEVQALREVFDEEDPDSGDETLNAEFTPSSGSQPLDNADNAAASYELIFCPPGALYVMPGSVFEPDSVHANILLEGFLRHVEPVYKLFHVPTLRSFMEFGAPLYGRDAEASCNKLLRASIYFAASVSLQDDECVTCFGKPRDQLALEHRKFVDIALYAADPLNTNEMATLQAMLLYVGSMRIIDTSRRAWSLMGLLVRIARAMNLHREPPGESIYIRELHRRLWHNLVFLDCYSAIDRGSEPAIHPDSFTRPLPLHVNDSDFGPETTSLVAREEELTDTSLALMAQEGADIVLRLSLPEAPENGETWQQRLELAYRYQRRIQAKFLRFCDADSPMQKLMIGIGSAASHSMILRAVRPMQYNLSSVPPRVDSPWVLQLAVNILRHCNSMWEETSLGGWRRMPWVPWHALAVALAGLCSMRGTALANEAWHLVDRNMLHYSASVADSRNGLLWKPIERLRRKAEAFRDASETTRVAPTAPAPPDIIQQMQTSAAQSSPFVNTPGLTTFSGSMVPMGIAPDSTFDFPPEMLANLPPEDTSWFDWESIMKDIGDVNVDGMQWQ